MARLHFLLAIFFLTIASTSSFTSSVVGVSNPAARHTHSGRAVRRPTFSVPSSARSTSRTFSTALNSEEDSKEETKFDVADGLVDEADRPPNPLKPLTDLQLAEQRKGLSVLEEKWRREREQEEYDNARLLGWTKQAEMYNGRFAMFFLVVGLLTEKWTGVTLPGQIEELLRVAGVIDMS